MVFITKLEYFSMSIFAMEVPNVAWYVILETYVDIA
jgi:hypothetical protein